MNHPIIGSRHISRSRTPRTLDEAYGWRATLSSENKRWPRRGSNWLAVIDIVVGVALVAALVVVILA